jgi:fructose-1,6-bisphosphatase I
VNPSGERQAEIDVYANELFASSLLATGLVSEVASEEMAEPRKGRGKVHVAMDPLDGSSNIATNNPLGSIFGFYSSALPCSGDNLVASAFVTYGPMLTLTFTTGEGVHTFVNVEGQEGNPFILMEESASIPEKAEVFGLGGDRRDWIEPVETFVASLEARGLKLRYGGTFVGDFNQVLRRGGIFGYPALKNKPRGKLRVLYEAAPMAFITKHAGGYASDGSRDVLSIVPSALAETAPLYLGTAGLVKEVESLIRGA